jgi:hypothetical protein
MLTLVANSYAAFRAAKGEQRVFARGVPANHSPSRTTFRAAAVARCCSEVRTHLQQLLTATAMNIVRVIAWLKGEPLGERRRQPGHFARLAPHPLSHRTVLC